MMSVAAQADWAEGLGKTVWERVRMIQELLKHANEDGMSKEDRVICVRQLARLRAETRTDR